MLEKSQWNTFSKQDVEEGFALYLETKEMDSQEDNISHLKMYL